ncbi:hypothetical protein VCHA43P277_90231 [Vibrio chagasii]|nr:hypothetical protein VCHA37O173_20012 [Vibrio chagasii]CAH6876603.1 hypothetical protein VCHA29O39_250028 [Vibrio chagasii]CAH7055867.1 hypothetical protein VCHA40P238_10242 [Vibrio chagasii]CAH7074069.1 hypothetical protein VCHA34P126_80010 [Vibrio chagasii]CAH7163329.1 hypothetical protein VCHA37P199_240011 [Vibrio chagasii]
MIDNLLHSIVYEFIILSNMHNALLRGEQRNTEVAAYRLKH